METRRGMPRALIKRDARASSLSRFARSAAEFARSLSPSLSGTDASPFRAIPANSAVGIDRNSSVSRLRRRNGSAGRSPIGNRER